jgi:hypothetical protein
MRINAAYRHARKIVNELSRCERLDNELAYILRRMYEYEDTLRQYTATLDGVEIKEG